MLSFNVKINENVHEIKDVDGNLFIGEVKSMVENVSGVPKNCQKWIYKGRILTDQMSLTESNIVDGNTVIVMRTAPTTPTPIANGSSSDVGKSVPSVGHSATVNQEAIRPSQSTVQFDNAMFELLQSADESAVLACVMTLLKVISNIIAFPLDDKYRRLNRTNTAFAKKVGSLSGGSSCMMALGFQLVGDDWILVPNASAWDNITSCKLKLEKFSQKLGDKIARDKGSQPVAAPALPPQGGITPSPLDPHAMQQFLQSLAAIQTILPLNPQASNSSETATIEQDTQGDVSSMDSKEEDEETIPQL
jgi:PUB domain/Ubiquitin family